MPLPVVIEVANPGERRVLTVIRLLHGEAVEGSPSLPEISLDWRSAHAVDFMGVLPWCDPT